MNIVVLDGYAMNPGDLIWSPLEKLGALTVYDRTSPEDRVKRAVDAQVVLTNKTLLMKDVLDQLPNLKYIGVLATGYNVVDIAETKRRGIIVTNVPAYSTDSVVQLVFAHILNWAWRVKEHSDSVLNGDWVNSRDFCYWNHPLVELNGLTMGIIGYGQIGRNIARIAGGFGMNVLINTRTIPDRLDEGIAHVSLGQLLGESDIVSLHCPLTEQTEHIINERTLSKMKPTALLINTGRGPLLDDKAVADALNSGRLGAAAIDVMTTEPPKADNPLLAAKNITITPHIGWATKAARQRLMETATENVAAFINGKPQNVVN